jgi:hypothetical protein
VPSKAYIEQMIRMVARGLPGDEARLGRGCRLDAFEDILRLSLLAALKLVAKTVYLYTENPKFS